jgi:protein phosphatase 1L
MMVDSVSTAKRGPTADLLTGEDDDGGFVCRGWKRLVLVSLYLLLYLSMVRVLGT